MLAKIVDGTVVEFPYNTATLFKENPNTSFPRTFTEETYNSFDIYTVKTPTIEEDFNPFTHKIEYGDTPVYKEGEWILETSLVELTKEEAAAMEDSKAQDVRGERDRLLTESDWMATSDRTMTDEEKAYRAALRDITNHANFPHLMPDDWPVAP